MFFLPPPRIPPPSQANPISPHPPHHLILAPPTYGPCPPGKKTLAPVSAGHHQRKQAGMEKAGPTPRERRSGSREADPPRARRGNRVGVNRTQHQAGRRDGQLTHTEWDNPEVPNWAGRGDRGCSFHAAVALCVCLAPPHHGPGGTSSTHPHPFFSSMPAMVRNGRECRRACKCRRWRRRDGMGWVESR